jgi:hypothetical protein
MGTVETRTTHGESEMKTYPLYQVIKMRDYFVVQMRYLRGYSYSYFTCEKMGRFETREAAQAAVAATKKAA